MKKVPFIGNRKIRALLAAFLGIWIVYILSATWFLNSTFLNHELNKKQPRFSMNWDRGYSWLPGLVFLKNVEIHVQSSRTEWDLNCEGVRFQVSLLPLFKREARFHRIHLEGTDFDLDRTKDRELLSPTNSKTGKIPWRLVLNDISIEDFRHCRIDDKVLDGEGQANGHFNYQFRNALETGPSQIHFRKASITYQDRRLAEDTDLTLDFEASPFIPSENRHLKWLQFLSGQLQVKGLLIEKDVPLSFFRRLPWLSIRDPGFFSGDIRMAKGLIQQGSKIGVEGTRLEASYQDLLVTGTGSMELTADQAMKEWDQPEKVILKVGFDKYEIQRQDLGHPLVQGDGLLMTIENNHFQLTEPFSETDLTIDMPRSRVSNMSDLNRYLGANHFLTIHNGTADLNSHIQFSSDKGESEGWMEVQTSDVSITAWDEPFQGGLTSKLKFSGLKPGKPQINLSGTTLTLTNSDKSWKSTTRIQDGFLSWSAKDLIRSKIRALKNASGKLEVQGDISDIRFLNAFLKSLKGFQLHGPGNYKGGFQIFEGELGPGSQFEFNIPEIEADLLGYMAKGKATLTGSIGSSSSGDHAHMDLSIQDYRVFRKDTSQLHSRGDSLMASLDLPRFSFGATDRDLDIEISLPNDDIPDMRTYNELWGDDAAFQILKGQGSASANFYYTSQNGVFKGQIQLRAPQMKAQYENLPISSDFEFVGKINSIDLDKMLFSVDGSRFSLDHVQTGDQSDGNPWKMRCNLTNSVLHWSTPMTFKASMMFDMTDSRPVLALFSEKKRSLKLIKPLLNIKDIQGDTQLELTDKFLDIRQLHLSGDKLNLEGRSRVGRGYQRGALYVVFRGVPFSVTLEGTTKRAHIIHPQRKYEDFRVFIPQP